MKAQTPWFNVDFWQINQIDKTGLLTQLKEIFQLMSFHPTKNQIATSPSLPLDYDKMLRLNSFYHDTAWPWIDELIFWLC